MRAYGGFTWGGVVLAVLASGCALSTTTGESRGVTRKQLAGTASLVFTNATPDTMCGLRIQQDGSKGYGDNWLPRGGLPSGKSIDLQVKPGTYMATWNTCKQTGRSYFAATLTSETAFTIKDDRDSKQLFAYVAGNEAPTKYAGARAFHAMVKFQGQPIGDGLPAPVIAKPKFVMMAAIDTPQAATALTAPPPVQKVDLSEFIDRQAVAKLVVKRAKTPPKAPVRASLARGLDIANQQVGYTERRR
jgi:hypothetical protein